MSDQGAKIFVSYSRADSGFAQELVSGIEACGFDAFIDKADIAHGEAWQSRLGDLINRADTIVWVVSPESLSSEIVAWELDTAAKASKRIVPVSYTTLDMSLVPVDLRRLNFCLFLNRPFGDALKDLALALRTDVGWLREHTRVADLARRWDELGRTDDLLLRGKELDAVRQWSSARPIHAPPLTDIQAGLIAASNRAQEDADRNAKRRGRRAALISGAVAIMMTGLAGVSVFQMLKAREANVELTTAQKSLVLNNEVLERTASEKEQANKELRQINATLASGVPLAIRVLGRDHTMNVGDRWTGFAVKSLQGIVRIEQAPNEFGQRSMVGSGFVLDGGSLVPDWQGRWVIVTAAFNIDPRFGIAATDPYATVVCLKEAEVEEECASAPLGEALFLSSIPTGPAVFEVPDALTDQILPLEGVDSAEFDRSFVKTLPQIADGRVLDDSGGQRFPRLTLSFGFPQGRNAELILMEVLGFGDIGNGDRAIWTAKGSEPGLSGAPVFNTRNFNVVGMHVRVGELGGERYSGATWIGDIITDIQTGYSVPPYDRSDADN
ncbi:MAG: toll/interleukin-1 receptor domain-containing protein [Acidobacteria bacterium]|nr:toll/interleukin-1 receptor domain-containing protein [Acidobacteriota bacterium]